MKKRALTLIEVMLALGIAAILLAVLFPSFTETIRMKKKLDHERAFVFAKSHVQSRLAALFSATSMLKTESNELHFTFDNGFDDDPKIRGKINASLALKKGVLYLSIEEHKELLFEGIKKMDFTFYDADEGKLIPKNDWEEGLPLFFILDLSLENDLKESFYFRLNGTNRLMYPKGEKVP